MNRFLELLTTTTFAAALILASASFYILRFRSEVVAVPISPDPPKAVSAEFKVDLDARYIVEVDLKRTLPASDLSAILEPGAGAPRPIDISWVVETRGRIVASSDSRGPHGAYWGSTVGATFGGFRAERERQYKISVTIDSPPSSRIQSTDPHLLVVLSPWTLRDRVISAQLSCAASIAVTLISVILASLTYAVRRRSNPRLEQAGAQPTHHGRASVGAGRSTAGR